LVPSVSALVSLTSGLAFLIHEQIPMNAKSEGTLQLMVRIALVKLIVLSIGMVAIQQCYFSRLN
jgi:hypothetical protein